jgi:hypothetical protein
MKLSTYDAFQSQERNQIGETSFCDGCWCRDRNGQDFINLLYQATDKKGVRNRNL